MGKPKEVVWENFSSAKPFSQAASRLFCGNVEIFRRIYPWDVQREAFCEEARTRVFLDERTGLYFRWPKKSFGPFLPSLHPLHALLVLCEYEAFRSVERSYEMSYKAFWSIYRMYLTNLHISTKWPSIGLRGWWSPFTNLHIFPQIPTNPHKIPHSYNLIGHPVVGYMYVENPLISTKEP